MVCDRGLFLHTPCGCSPPRTDTRHCFQLMVNQLVHLKDVLFWRKGKFDRDAAVQRLTRAVLSDGKAQLGILSFLNVSLLLLCSLVSLCGNSPSLIWEHPFRPCKLFKFWAFFLLSLWSRRKCGHRPPSGSTEMSTVRRDSRRRSLGPDFHSQMSGNIHSSFWLALKQDQLYLVLPAVTALRQGPIPNVWCVYAVPGLTEVKAVLNKDDKIIVACIAGGTLKPTPNLAEGSQSRSVFIGNFACKHLFENF